MWILPSFEEQDEGQRSNRAQAGARRSSSGSLATFGRDAPCLVVGEQVRRRSDWQIGSRPHSIASSASCPPLGELIQPNTSNYLCPHKAAS
jgi:hypothetical protein